MSEKIQQDNEGDNGVAYVTIAESSKRYDIMMIILS